MADLGYSGLTASQLHQQPGAGVVAQVRARVARRRHVCAAQSQRVTTELQGVASLPAPGSRPAETPHRHPTSPVRHAMPGPDLAGGRPGAQLNKSCA